MRWDRIVFEEIGSEFIYIIIINRQKKALNERKKKLFGPINFLHFLLTHNIISYKWHKLSTITEWKKVIKKKFFFLSNHSFYRLDLFFFFFLIIPNYYYRKHNYYYYYLTVTFFIVTHTNEHEHEKKHSSFFFCSRHTHTHGG